MKRQRAVGDYQLCMKHGITLRALCDASLSDATEVINCCADATDLTRETSGTGNAVRSSLGRHGLVDATARGRSLRQACKTLVDGEGALACYSGSFKPEMRRAQCTTNASDRGRRSPSHVSGNFLQRSQQKRTVPPCLVAPINAVHVAGPFGQYRLTKLSGFFATCSLAAPGKGSLCQSQSRR